MILVVQTKQALPAIVFWNVALNGSSHSNDTCFIFMKTRTPFQCYSFKKKIKSSDGYLIWKVCFPLSAFKLVFFFSIVFRGIFVAAVYNREVSCWSGKWLLHLELHSVYEMSGWAVVSSWNMLRSVDSWFPVWHNILLHSVKTLVSWDPDKTCFCVPFLCCLWHIIIMTKEVLSIFC